MTHTTHQPFPRLRLICLMLAICLLGAAASQAADTDIVITEIMNNPAVLGDANGEWFEIHNTGPDPVDIAGWTISDLGADDHLIPSVGPIVVAPGAYAVIARDSTTMVSEGVTVLYQYSGVFLANGDDEVILTNASAQVIDTVAYDGGPVWPDPTGASMMWDESTGDNNIGSNWAEAGAGFAFGSGDFGTPGVTNGAPALLAPVVSAVFHRSILPEPGETVVVSADVVDDGVLASITLQTTIDSVPQLDIMMANAGGDTWTATIPAGLLGETIGYTVVAVDTDAEVGTSATYTYVVANEMITPIASIHADSVGFDGTTVMIEGQVYLPGNYQADGTSVSAYVMDGSGRGLNVYGTFISTGGADLSDPTNIVKVSGTVDYLGDTLEIIRYEVELVSTGNPVLTPELLGTGAAELAENIGNYIGSTGVITSMYTTAGGNPAHNFTIDDGSGPLVIRIDDDVVAGMEFWLVGDELVAAGAGSRYADAGQILVGLVSDIVNNGQGPDVVPPTLSGATLTDATEITLQFSEGIDAATGGNAGNYEVYETATPANTIAVSAALVQADSTKVVLTVAAGVVGTPHTVRINNVTDLIGNPIAANTTAEIIEPGDVNIIITEVMRNPAVLSDAVGEWFEIYNTGVDAVDLNGWTITDEGTDNHVIDNGGPLVIEPGAYMVLGVDAVTMALEGVTLGYEYSGMALGNSADELILLDGAMLMIDTVIWDGGLEWPNPVGYSMQWTGLGDNDLPEFWSGVGPVFGSGDHGTPGLVNDIEVTGVPDVVVATVLGANYPNPFNPSTTFSFSLAKADHVTLEVFDVRGRLVSTVVDDELPAGNYANSYRWDGCDNNGHPVNSGTYLYSLRTGDGFVGGRKMLLLK